MTCDIRSLDINDYAEAATLWARCSGLAPAPSQEDLRRFLAHNPDLSVAAQGSGGLVGLLLVSYDGMRGHLSRLAVDPDARRQGIARALVDAAVHRLQQRGAKRCHLLVYGDNHQAMAFWRATGWEHYPSVEMWGRRLDEAQTG